MRLLRLSKKQKICENTLIEKYSRAHMYVPLKTLEVWLRLAEKVRANKFLLNWKGYFWCLPFCRETLNICKFQSVKQTTRMLVESCPLNFWRPGNWALIIDIAGRGNKKKKGVSGDIDIYQQLLPHMSKRISSDCMPCAHTWYLSTFLHNHNLRPGNFTLESA